MELTLKIVFIGAGNVATTLAKALDKKHQIIQVYNRSNASAKRLGNIVKCPFINDLGKITTQADVYIIAVKDDAIEKVAATLRVKNKVVIHTSGSVGIDVLKKTSTNYGVFWPLQTFSKGSILKKDVPFCIETSSKKIVTLLTALSKELGGKAYYINSAQRGTLHLAAVFANNFSNLMYSIAYNILEDEGVPFDVLLPLIRETVNKLQKQDPAKNQTGPASRGDKKTIKRHEKMLEKNPQYLKLYKLLTQNIQLGTHAKKL